METIDKPKCIIKDLIHDLTEIYNIKEIALDVSGIGQSIADALEFCGVKVVEIHKNKVKTLSDKIYHFGLESPFAYGLNIIFIKQFIKKLKEDIEDCDVDGRGTISKDGILDCLDKRAGDKLI